jgi:hypothetical protein
MNTRNSSSVAGLVAALLMPMQLPAAAPSHQCSQLWDDVLRLSCYDTAFGKPRPPAEAAAAPAAGVPAAAAVAAAPVAAAAAAPAAATPTAPAAGAAAGSSVPATAAVVVPAAAASQPAAVPAPAAATPPAAGSTAKDGKKGGNVVASVTAVGQTLDGRLRITLDNGQVWQQTELESVNPVRTDTEQAYQLFQVKPGDQVTVKSGVMGSRQMVAANGRTARVMLLK